MEESRKERAYRTGINKKGEEKGKRCYWKEGRKKEKKKSKEEANEKENKEQRRNEEKIDKMRENFLKVWYRKFTDLF